MGFKPEILEHGRYDRACEASKAENNNAEESDKDGPVESPWNYIGAFIHHLPGQRHSCGTASS